MSIMAHSLQAAALASTDGDDEVVVAALLHDIGHVVGMEAGYDLQMDGCGILNHENIGADFLADLGFSARVQKLVANHVSAKRYLCYKSKEYYRNLTEASKTTLVYQGGPMEEAEASAYEQDPDFNTYISMRKYDEGAKVPNLAVPDFDSYRALIERFSSGTSTSYTVSKCQKQFYDENNYVKFPHLLAFYDIYPSDAKEWVRDVSTWSPNVTNSYLMHYEKSDLSPEGKMLCRVENFAKYSKPIGNLCYSILKDVCTQLFREEAVLMKEKINFKLPGGAGFFTHQDSPAYLNMGHEHISVMVAIDDATKENGCLQVAPGVWAKGQVALTADGVVTPEEEATMTFKHLECAAGTVVMFGGYLPHKSEANTSSASRRAMYITYNPRSQGDFHDEYYLAKHSGLQGFSAGNAISFQNDFQGQIVH